MATRVAAVDELLCIEELERKLTALINHVLLEKEKVHSNFQQLHTLLAVREHSLLQELDDIVMRERQEIPEKRKLLQELNTARESLQRDLTSNKLREVLEMNLRTLEDKIGEEVARNVGWVELDWRKEQLEQSVIDVCKVVILEERLFRSEDYSLKLCPVWSRGGTGAGQIKFPKQLAIDTTTHNIFVNDSVEIQVFDREGNHLYKIPMTQNPNPNGIALTNTFIFVTTAFGLVKIDKSTNIPIKSVRIETVVRGIDIDNNTNIYVCQGFEQSILVFDNDLNFMKAVQLKSHQIQRHTQTNCIKLYEDNMYIMFGNYPPFHLQIFSLEGELIRCLISARDIDWSYFFSIDRLGNIVVADCYKDRIKIFSNTGELIHTITSDMLPGDQKFDKPFGVAIDRQNRIIVAHQNKECSLLAF